MINKKFNTPFAILRNQWTTEIINDVPVDRSEEVEVSSFQGYRQQASPEYVQNLGLSFSKPHIVWCPVDTAVAEGDKLRSEFGIDHVRAKQVNRDGMNPHIELLVEFIGEEIES